MKRLLVLALVLCSVPAGAATYYVDCTAAAGGDGSLATPWDAVADVNGATFAAGDFVLFKRGCTWRETLTVPSSGGAGNPITFGPYGSAGADPIISGADLLSPWTAEAPAYYASAAAKPGWVVVDVSSRLTENAVSKASLVPGQWFWEVGTSRVYVRLIGDAAPSTRSVVGTQRNNAIVSGRSNIAFANLQLRETSDNGFFQNGGGTSTLTSLSSNWNKTSGFLIRASNMTLASAVASRNGYYGFSFDGVYSNITLTALTASYNGQHGLRLASSTAVSVAGGEFSYNGTASSEGNGIDIEGDAGGDAATVSIAGAESHHNAGNGIAVTTSGGAGVNAVTISGGSFHDNDAGPNPCAGIRLDTLTHSSVVKFVAVYGNGSAGIVVEDQAYSNQVYYNISYSNQNGITHSAAPGNGNVYYNNTCWNNTQDGFQIPAGSPNVATVKNNIFSGNGRYGYNTGGGAHIVDYNDVSGNVTANYNGISQPAHDTISDPLFIDTGAADFHLRSGSPAINAGVNVGLTRDFLGRAIVGLPDIGAYEAGCPVPFGVVRYPTPAISATFGMVYGPGTCKGR